MCEHAPGGCHAIGMPAGPPGRGHRRYCQARLRPLPGSRLRESGMQIDGKPLIKFDMIQRQIHDHEMFGDSIKALASVIAP